MAETTCCDKLKCSLCDLPVVCFFNKEWSPAADYLFVRTKYAPFHVSSDSVT
jgi:hypothetical protein